MTVSAPTSAHTHQNPDVKKYDSPQSPASQLQSSSLISTSLKTAIDRFTGAGAVKPEAGADTVTISNAAQAASRQSEPFSTPQTQSTAR